MKEQIKKIQDELENEEQLKIKCLERINNIFNLTLMISLAECMIELFKKEDENE